MGEYQPTMSVLHQLARILCTIYNHLRVHAYAMKQINSVHILQDSLLILRGANLTEGLLVGSFTGNDSLDPVHSIYSINKDQHGVTVTKRLTVNSLLCGRLDVEIL